MASITGLEQGVRVPDVTPVDPEALRQLIAGAVEQAQAAQVAAQGAVQAPPQVVRDYAQALRDHSQAARDAVEAGAPVPPMPPAPPGVRVISVGDQHIIMGGDVTEIVEVPGGVTGTGTGEPPPFPPFPQTDIPEGVVIVSVAFFIMVAAIVIGWPISRAMGRRMDRRNQAPPQQVVAESAAAIHRIEQAVDTLALEMERVSENQRFVTKLLADRQLAPAEQLPEGRGR